jgi:hypothetical protein
LSLYSPLVSSVPSKREREREEGTYDEVVLESISTLQPRRQHTPIHNRFSLLDKFLILLIELLRDLLPLENDERLLVSLDPIVFEVRFIFPVD